mgnify:CR=1 FL=1
MPSIVMVLNGPNLNLLGTREPHIYGAETLTDVENHLIQTGKDLGISVSCFQSNSEGDIVSRIHQARGETDFIIINAGAYTHTSVALHDAIKGTGVPLVELHISNVFAREPFRHHSYISPVARAVMCGWGVQGYALAIDGLAQTPAV